MKIECISQPPRKGGTHVALPIAGAAHLERKYHFTNPSDDPKLADEAPHVAEVADEAHVSLLLAVSEAFRPYREPLTPEEEAAEIERIRIETAAAAEQAAREAADKAAAEQAEIERQVAAEEALRAAAMALRDNQIGAAEAEAARAGVHAEPVEPVTAPETAMAQGRAQQVAALAAEAAADRARAEAVRKAGTMSLGEAQAEYRRVLQKNPSPRWDVETLLEKIAAGAGGEG